MRIGVISDIYLDVNKHFPVLESLCDFCNENHLDKIIIAGDFASDFSVVSYTIDYFNKNTRIKLHFVPDNHDLYICRGKNSKQIYDVLSHFKECLVNCPVDLGEWVIIGDTGWYDCSYRDKFYTIEQIQKKSCGGMTWADKRYFQWG